MAAHFIPRGQFACAACGAEYARETVVSECRVVTGHIVRNVSTNRGYVFPARKNSGDRRKEF
jgi:DNA polymerase II large subunit